MVDTSNIYNANKILPQLDDTWMQGSAIFLLKILSV